MKKIFFVAILGLMALNLFIYVHTAYRTPEPYQGFMDRLDMAPMKEYADPEFGYRVKYPSFFSEEKTDTGHTRFCYRRDVNILLESYVDMNPGSELLARKDATFIIVAPVYENGVRIDGYSRYDKYIRSGRTFFVLSLVYPDSYKPALQRLFRLVDDWSVLGAVS